MTWRSITIAGDDAHELASARLIEEFARLHRAAGALADAAVFHRRHGDGSHSYFFSPMASRIAAAMLDQRQAAECAEPTGENRLVRVRL